jgi:hypothetical protein
MIGDHYSRRCWLVINGPAIGRCGLNIHAADTPSRLAGVAEAQTCHFPSFMRLSRWIVSLHDFRASMHRHLVQSEALGLGQ